LLSLAPLSDFWSLTMCDKGVLPVWQPSEQDTLSPRNAREDKTDGALDTQLEQGSPGSNWRANWLWPADGFVLTLRMDWPQEKPSSILDDHQENPRVTPIR
jgi:hypothetical protein